MLLNAATINTLTMKKISLFSMAFCRSTKRKELPTNLQSTIISSFIQKEKIKEKRKEAEESETLRMTKGKDK